MTSSFSTYLKLELMVTGENAGTWGTKTNTNLNLLQQAIAGYQDISIAGGAQTTALTMDNAAISNARNAVVKLTGTITGNQIVTVPNGIEKTYIVQNGTTGAFTVEFKTASGTGPTFSTTDKGIKILFADGTNVVDVNANFSSSSFPEIKVPQINDSNGNEEIKFTTTASAVNEFTIANAATGNGPEISATGSDTNIDLKLTPKGTGKLNLDGIKFPNADGSAGQALVTNGSGTLSFASAGLAWQSVKTSNFTAVKGEAYPINTTSSAITVTLPATPTAGDQVQVVDYAGTFDTNALTINPNGEDIQGGASNLLLTGEREGVILTYIDSTQGWIATSGINEGTNALEATTYSADFLVIAGGGGAGSGYGNGNGLGGGGAGGYRSSNSTYGSSGGGGSAESSLTFDKGIVYTITVGAGGNGGTLNKAPNAGGESGTSGSNSSISGTGITTITSTGGGAGTTSTSSSGGSGGGSSGGGAGSGTANQGFAGGNFNGSSVYQAGGGGGSSAVGVNGNAAGTGPNGTGAGGAGTSSTITGTGVTRAGGGGGGRYQGSSTGTGGTGGGGAGGSGTNPATAGVAGTVNTGGGGGGGGSPNPGITGSNGGNGGKGVVILRMPTNKYSGTTTGSPTVTTSGADTILTFNDSGSYTG
jgi:hypothetical protein